MKKQIWLLLVFLFSQIALYAQALGNENFIYTEVPQKTVKSTNYGSLSVSEKQTSVTYFNGVGRLLETIAIDMGEGIRLIF